MVRWDLKGKSWVTPLDFTARHINILLAGQLAVRKNIAPIEINSSKDVTILLVPDANLLVPSSKRFKLKIIWGKRMASSGCNSVITRRFVD